jgi:hypothetical protein
MTTTATPIERLRGHLARHGHVAVALPASAAARGDELAAAVPALLGDPECVRRMAALADAWAPSPIERAAVSWGSRSADDPRGGKSHLQTVKEFDRFVVADTRAPVLVRAVLARLSGFAEAAGRLLAGLAVPLHSTVRANVYGAGGGVPTHVDESALTVVFTDRPDRLLVAAGGRRVPLRPVAARGWHAVVLPGEAVGAVLPGLAPSPHAAAPTLDGLRLSITVFATVDWEALHWAA